MKNITLLLTILSALIITGCDKGTETTASEESADTMNAAVETVQESASEAAVAVEGAAEEVMGKSQQAVLRNNIYTQQLITMLFS